MKKLLISIVILLSWHSLTTAKTTKKKKLAHPKKVSLAKKSNTQKKIPVQKTAAPATTQALTSTQAVATTQASTPETKQNRKRWEIDKIMVRVNGNNILQSHLEQPQLGKEGGFYTLNEMVEEELLCQKAVERHMVPTPADINRQIVNLKIQSGMPNVSDEEFEKQLKENGFNLPMYKRQLSRLMAAENLKRAEISEKVIVTSQEVEAHYQNNPIFLPARYHLKMAAIPEDKIADYKKLIKAQDITWKDLGWVEKSEVGEQYSSVLAMNKGFVSKPIKSQEKYHSILLADKEEGRVKSLDECYFAIEAQLRNQKREKLLEKLMCDIKEKAVIVNL